ncbi:MAG: Omp28-related outer membrane protein [Saprospiraceae bacterium]|nr:Omp28-related outer membrane protein [Saprospiraceae bacterium]
MLKLFMCALWVLGFFLDSISQASFIAPRNKTFAKPVLQVFSGIQCNICEIGDKALSNITKEHKPCIPNIINYHAGPFAVPANLNQRDLRTTCGEFIRSQYSINSYPGAILNGNSGRIINANQFESSYFNIVEYYTPVNLGIKTLFDSVSRKIQIEVELYPMPGFSDSSAILDLHLISNGIKGFQKMLDGSDNYQYIHNNVFIDAITPCQGEWVRSLKVKTSRRLQYTYDLASELNPLNIECIAILKGSDGTYFTSETQKIIDSQTKLGLTLSNDQDSTWLLKPGDIQKIDFTAINSSGKRSDFLFSFKKEIPEFWNAEFLIDGESKSDSIAVSLESSEEKSIRIIIQTNGFAGFGELSFESVQMVPSNVCGTDPIRKKIICQPVECNTLVVYNTAKQTNGQECKVNLWKPITDALDCFLCKDYVVLSDIEFEKLYLNEYEKVPRVIYYQLGWGNPPVRPANYTIMRRFMDLGTGVFIAGQDIGYQMASNLPGSSSNQASKYFHSSYLSARFLNNGDSTINYAFANSNDPEFGHIGTSDILPIYRDSISLNLYPDVINSTSANAKTLFSYTENKIGGYYFERLPHKVIYSGVGMEMFGNKNFVKELITKAHIWFNGCDKIISNAKQHVIENQVCRFYPNPFKDVLHFEFKSNDKFEIKIWTADLKLILHQIKVDNLNRISTSNLPTGIYYYTIIDKENQIYASGGLMKM